MFETQQYQKADTYFVKAVEKDLDYAIVYLLLWDCNLINVEKYLYRALKLDRFSVASKITCTKVLRLIEIERYVFNIISYNYCTLQFCKGIYNYV